MALLASRRNKYRQSPRVERRTSNFLELPGAESTVSESFIIIILIINTVVLLLFLTLR